jgi:hypothetical protein
MGVVSLVTANGYHNYSKDNGLDKAAGDIYQGHGGFDPGEV